ncbi:copper chaperone CopZ [Bacillus sp. FJAT-47783]|uniref:copper chaperone CopZ n=1 Tax=Bacillus sp. FJAT-47783 TaxID=2922712 RepID=UPI001FAD650D|nr:copper chaperone CopZ [Bacillus sp. FJAT-47783]
MRIETLTVKGMSCNHCVNAVETSVGSLIGVQSVKVQLADEKVKVEFDETKVSADKIKDTIEDQGYDVV